MGQQILHFLYLAKSGVIAFYITAWHVQLICGRPWPWHKFITFLPGSSTTLAWGNLRQFYCLLVRNSENLLKSTVADLQGAEPAPPPPFGRRTDAITLLLISDKSLANAKIPCGCSVLCIHPKSSLCSCPHYWHIVIFTGKFYQLTKRDAIRMHVEATMG